MVEAVSMNTPSVYNQPQQKKSHAGRNFFLGAATGAAVGGTIGYFTKSLFKDGAPTDEFVHKTLLEVAHEPKLKLAEAIDREEAYDMIKKFQEKEPNIEKIKEFINRYAESLQENVPTNKTDKAYKDIFDKIIADYKDDCVKLKTMITNAYDKTTKKLDSSLLGIFEEDVTGAMHRLKFGAAAKWGAISAAALGTIAFVASKISANKNNA